MNLETVFKYGCGSQWANIFSGLKRLCLFLLLFSIMGCSPTSLEEYRREGEALCRRFTKELQKIETRDELLAALPNIKKRYEEFVDLMLEVKEFEEEHFGEATDLWNTSDFLASESLMIEMKRLYHLEGGRELMEKTQREALFRLDAALRR